MGESLQSDRADRGAGQRCKAAACVRKGQAGILFTEPPESAWLHEHPCLGGRHHLQRCSGAAKWQKALAGGHQAREGAWLPTG